MAMMELWTQAGSIMATIMFTWAIIQQYFPYNLRTPIEKYAQKALNFVYPYITITFPEYSGERLRRSEAFSTVQNYLRSRTSNGAKRLKAETVENSNSLILTMDDNEEILDEFQGAKIWWTSKKTETKSQTFSFYPTSDERRFIKLCFHRRHRDLITGLFLNHVMEEGKAVEVMNRRRKLFMNNSGNNGWKKSNWSHVPFEHPANFGTLAMDPNKKQEIVNDLTKFKNGKNYYEKVGKAWKRGYLLYGPPGTGKSTMIAAVANFMEYDVYDLELTSVKDNTELKKLLIEISNKSIIVIEDIDCSLDLTGKRKTKKKTDEEETGERKDPVVKKAEEEEEEEKKVSKVTLSGLLNFIDGIWSACGRERLIIFTTNHKEKLDEALIRRGRMDKHIEMWYCCFEAFKVLAMNYLDVEVHDSFDRIRQLLETIEMSPADVAENLMPKYEGEETEDCFKRLIEALENAKEEAAKKEEIEKEKEKEKLSVNNNKDDEIKCNGASTKESKENGEVEKDQSN